MNKYSPISRTRLDLCHPDLQVIFETVLPIIDHSILCGHRNEDDQEGCFLAKTSKLQWPNSWHNKLPSMAVDSGPYNIYIRNVDYKDLQRLCFFAGIVMGVAARLLAEKKILHRVRWGGDWDMDTELHDQKFRDLVHFELVPL